MKKILKIVLFVLMIILILEITTFAKEDDEYKMGDIDGDTIIDIEDYMKVTRFIKKYEVPTEKQKKAADVNNDNEIDIADAIKLLRVIKKYETFEENIVFVSKTGNDETGVGTEDKPYKTLEKAFDISNSGKTIKLLSDIDFEATYVISEGEFTLDLNGFKIIEVVDQNIQEIGVSGQIFTLQENAKLTINGQEEGSQIANITGSDIIYVRDNASLTINGGEYIDNTSRELSYHSNVIRLYGNPTLEINDGYFESQNTAINVEGIEENKITINGGEFYAKRPIMLCDYGYRKSYTNN